MKKQNKRYKFLRTGLKSENGNVKWEVGVWKMFRGELKMCEAGFHCSVEPYDAFSFVQGEILAEVEVRGKSLVEENKEVWSEMRVVKAYRWTKKDSLKLAIYCAELVLENFERKFPNDKRPREAIEAAKKVLLEDTAKNRAAARVAARSAELAADSAGSAKSAAWSAELAAESVAESAELAAESAAWAAVSATDSAGSAAESTVKKIRRYFRKLVKDLREIEKVKGRKEENEKTK